MVWSRYIKVSYTVLHIFRQVLFWAGNQSDHQNFDQSLLSYKYWLIFIRKRKKIKMANSWNFCEKILRIGGVEKSQFFWVGRFESFFTKKKCFFASSQWKSVNIYRIARVDPNLDDYPGFQPKTTPASRYATQCKAFSNVLHVKFFKMRPLWKILWFCIDDLTPPNIRYNFCSIAYIVSCYCWLNTIQGFLIA